MVLSRRLRDSERTFTVPRTVGTILEWTDDRVRQLQRFSVINIGDADVSLQLQQHNGTTWQNLGAAITAVAKGGPVSVERNPSFNRVRLRGQSTDADPRAEALIVLQYANESDLDTAVPPGDND